MKMINFDHCYTEDMGHKFLKTLERAGFTLSEHQVEHPGKHFCRFIMFNLGKEGKGYLEFVNVGKGGQRIDKPGLSLNYSGLLKKYFNIVKRRKGVEAKYIHKNYQWKKDSKSRLPGWNFITFSKPQFKNLYTWFTEYEPRSERKRLAVVPHPNTALRVAGLELSVRTQDRPKIETIFGRKFDSDNINLGGINLFIQSARSTKLTTIIIECKSLKKFLKYAGDKAQITWRGKKAAMIKNPDRRMWNIIVIEKKGK